MGALSDRLAIDLTANVIPISKTASSLAMQIKKGQPVVITQKGRPQAVLISVELFTELTALVDAAPVIPA